MIETYPFAGRMDTDSPDLVFPRGSHRSAFNGVFKGTQGNMQFQTAPGTTLIPNSFLPDVGTNMTIGCKYDAVKQRLFIFNANSAGNNAIFIYYTVQGNFVRLIQDGVNTSDAPLSFNAAQRINGVSILYGDGQSGDLLFFVDSLFRPRKLNIDRLLNNGYSPIKSDFLKVIKAPPVMVPQVTYENDFTVTANNLINCLWQFAYTFLYDDYEESVISSASIVPLPSVAFDTSKNIPVSESARIGCYLQTGDQNVTKIRLYGRQTTNGGSSGWLIIDTLIKSDLSIPNNTVYKYLFYNNGNYIAVDPAFAVELFDLVPLKANDQALLDGNVISYGAITEGYNYFTPTNIGSSIPNQMVPAYTINSVLFFGSSNGQFTGGQPQFTFYLTGVGQNDGSGNATDLDLAPANLIVVAKSDGTDIGFTLSNTNRNIATVLFNLRSSAATAGWQFVSSTSNSLTIYYPSGNVVLENAHLFGATSETQPYNLDQFAHFPQANYQYGIVYFDEDGRTNGVITNAQAQITTPGYAPNVTQIPEVTIQFEYTPPVWATYYNLVRTDNLTYQKYLQWVSASAYGNNLATEAQQFGYFGISNIQDYNLSINATTNVVSYQFSPGDRIRITARYDGSGNLVNILNLDYTILGVAVNPIVNGVQQTGSFVQISYPSADINGNFKLDGTPNYQNYQILLYSYKAQNPTGQNVFYEIGQRFGIGNPGTPAAYHFGTNEDNVLTVTDGDVFYRTRIVPITAEYTVPTGNFIQGSSYSTMWINPGGGGIPIVDNGRYAIRGSVNKVAGLTNTTYPTFSDSDYDILNESGSTLTVRVRYTLNVTDTTDPNGQFQGYIKIAAPGNVITVYTVLPLQTGLKVGVTNTYIIDATVPLPAGAKMWFVNFAQNQMSIVSSAITVDFVTNITLNVYDYSYSDIYELKTNADNRPNVVDTTALQTYFSTLFRYSEPYQLGANINNTNRFYAVNFDEFDKSYGDIIRLIVRQREMRVFQKRRCGRVGIYQKFIKNNAGNTDLVVSDTIITQNNIQYFEGEWGIGNQSSSLSSAGYADYFADPVKGYFCRLSLDGIVPISELYKCQTFAGSNLPNYLTNYFYGFGGFASILSVYNVLPDRDSEIIFCLQSGGPTIPGGSGIPMQAISFNETMNAWQSFYDFAPDSIVCCENLLYSFWNGNVYTHNSTNYANYYGVQHPVNINPLYIYPALEKKNFLALTQVCSQPWESPEIYTNTNSYGTQRQESNLVAADYALLGADYHAGFWFDQHSQAGLIDGDVLSGNLLSILFQLDDPAVFAYLSNISISWTENKMTNK